VTRYCVEISRTYEIQAEDEEDAVDKALERDWVQEGSKPTIVVTDLDEIERSAQAMRAAQTPLEDYIGSLGLPDQPAGDA
jgi:hypothetical protein